MSLKTLDDKIDGATHAAMGALGLAVSAHATLAIDLNEAIREIAARADVTSDDKEREARP